MRPIETPSPVETAKHMTRLLLLTAVALAIPFATAFPTDTTRTDAPAKAVFPFPYRWDKFPTAWFAANATNWEDEAQIELIGKYSMAILGWQHLDNPLDWTAVVYTQLTQAAIIKNKHPDLPVFVYCGYGFAFGLNAGTWPVMESVLADPNSSPYRDFFLQSAHGPVFTHTNCQQGHTSTGATGNHCLGYFWNMANSSARDYFVEKLVTPLATAPMIDGIFYDAFNYGYDIPEVTPWGLQTTNVPNCSKRGGAGCQALVDGSIDVAVRTAKLLNKHNKVPMYANPGTFKHPLVGQNIWLNESQLVEALDGLSWMTYYESMRADTVMNGCPGAKVTAGWCILDNLLTESKLGVAAGVHTYLQHVNATDPSSPVESQLSHMAVFMLAQEENWYYFGSTGWWDQDFHWEELYDQATSCGKPTEAAPEAGSGPLYSRKFEHCTVSLDCTNATGACEGDIQFGATSETT